MVKVCLTLEFEAFKDHKNSEICQIYIAIYMIFNKKMCHDLAYIVLGPLRRVSLVQSIESSLTPRNSMLS